MVEGDDYVIADVRELGSGNFEVTATLLHGPGHRIRILIDRAMSTDIPGAVQLHMAGLKPVPTGER